MAALNPLVQPFFLLICSLVCSALANAPPGYSRRGTPLVRLSAVSRQDLFSRRSDSFGIAYGADLLYSNSENYWSGHSAFVTHILVKSDAPILVLENMEHHFRRVECSTTTIRLDFTTQTGHESAREACEGLSGGYVISSHDGCNLEGERLVFKVDRVHILDDDSSVLFQVARIPWKEAFPSSGIRFGYTETRHLFRRSSNSTSSNLRNTTDHTFKLDLSSQLLDQVLDPTEIPGLGDHFPNLPITFSCKNCTTTGTLELTRGAFDDIDIDYFIEASLRDFEAYIQLESTLTKKGALSLAPFKFPLFGFIIPAVAGYIEIDYTPSIDIEYKLASGIDFVYGFDLVAPGNPTITLDFGNREFNSTGFDTIDLTALPFTANFSNPSIEASIALRHKLSFTISVATLEATCDATLGLPVVNATVSPEGAVDQNCNPLPSSSTGNITSQTLNELGNLTNIDVDVGMDLSVDLSVGAFGQDIEVVDPVTVFETVLPTLVPTACLAFYNGEFTPASEAFAEVSASISVKTNAAGARVHDNNPLRLRAGSYLGLVKSATVWMFAIFILGVVVL